MAITQTYVDYGAGNDGTGDGTIGTPWKTLQKAFDTLTRNATDGNQVNLKAGTAHVNAAALDLATFVGGGALSWVAPLVLRGYTAAANDGGIGEIDCGGATLWADTYQYLTLMDLEIHSFGNNSGVAVGSFTHLIRCEIHKGASTPSGKYLVDIKGWSFVDSCYLHDPGTSGTCLFGGSFVELTNSFISGGGSWLVDFRYMARAQDCIFSIAADTNGVRFYAVPDRTEVLGCIFYSPDGTDGALLIMSGGSYAGKVVNNIFVGGDGDACSIDNNAGMLGYNAFYDNVANYNLADQVRVDWRAHDVALAANPFTDPANGDFSLTSAAKTALRGLGWPAAYLGAHANTDGHVTIGPIQYGEAEGGVCDYPSEDDVRATVTYDIYTGNMTLPAVGNVRDGVTYGTDGTELEGTLALPAEDDVEDSVGYGTDGSEFTGTVTLPTEVQVEDTVQYGADGIEFTGSLVVAGMPDWTDDEKKQIRQALGITGTTAATTGTGNLDLALADTGELQTEWADGGRLDLILDATATSAELASENDVADAVWDEVRAGHVAAGSFGAVTEWAAATDTAAIADAVWDELSTGHVSAGKAGTQLWTDIDAIKAKTDTIGALAVTISAPVAASGTITVIRGDDYLLTDGRELSFTGTNWPVITGATVTLRVLFPTVIAYTATVTGAAACYVPLTDTQTEALTPGVYSYDLQATLLNTSVVTLQQGAFNVQADVR